MSIKYYVLDAEGEAQPATFDAYLDALTNGNNNRENPLWRVARDTVGGMDISTVFLGLNHQYIPGGRPLVFETMVFGGGLRVRPAAVPRGTAGGWLGEAQ